MVFDNCVRTGYSKLKETPPIKKVNRGTMTNIPKDIKNLGICFPVLSCCFLAYLNTKIIATNDAIIE